MSIERGHLKLVSSRLENEPVNSDEVIIGLDVANSPEEIDQLMEMLARMGPVVIVGQPGQEMYALSKATAGKQVYWTYTQEEGDKVAVIFSGVEEITVLGGLHGRLSEVKSVRAAVFSTAHRPGIENEVADLGTRNKMRSTANNSGEAAHHPRVAIPLGSNREIILSGLKEEAGL